MRPDIDCRDPTIVDLENKLKLVMADYQNLERRTTEEIRDAVGKRVDGLMQDLITIRDNQGLACNRG